MVQNLGFFFFKSWPTGVGWGHNKGNLFLHVLIKGIFKRSSQKNQWAHRAQIYIKVFGYRTNASLLVIAPGGPVGAR
jgi:hypothetical protein